MPVRYGRDVSRFLNVRQSPSLHLAQLFDGQLLQLSWLRAHGCDWNSDTNRAAAGSGHLGVLRWAFTNGCPWDSSVCEAAALGGDVPVLQSAHGIWMYVQVQHVTENCLFCSGSCQRLPVGRATCSAALMHGHLSLLQWARANSCPWNEYTYASAALRGQLSVLQWARSNGCDWDSLTCFAAARGGHLEVLQWARTNGCPWDVRTVWGGVRGAHVEMLRWPRANGCDWGELTMYRAREVLEFDLWDLEYEDPESDECWMSGICEIK